MLHCPYCGSIVKVEEKYCVSCGEVLPEDIHLRSHIKKKFNRYWIYPFVTFILILFLVILFDKFLENQTSKALKNYTLGEQQIEDGNYEAAEEYFLTALNQKPNFNQAETGLEFTKITVMINELIEKSNTELNQNNFQPALSLIKEAENLLNNFDGAATSTLVDKIVSQQDKVKIEQLKSLLTESPSIEELKVLLWEADAIKNNEADDITNNIRSQIVDFIFSKASEQLSKKQFNDALLIVEDGLKYAPQSEKLQSLKTTIEKEKVSFEITQEQRIQQAIDTALEEQELNETDAIEVVSVKLENDKQGNLVVKGEVKSVATIPISSVLIEYSLLMNDTEFLTNDIYVYPDTLYPNEKGNFEFTHYDIDQVEKDIEIVINRVTWYTNY
ncbi:zinc ribbon domain-containing protein [Ornithinibacillus halotolerans]|uniref:Zinc ribbon domain-containing protein n=1 Tax=Ornithinibacillus halotolerans TaxID=1274357 RepID=A0A916S7Z8_9BACI|nr:zinc ribbon domain-containing protein [Ornithinibacillus halotolerans]GGA87774.1 hypothetical protein GCM10008025_33150 [Ornithinibacillus halotolerans]